MIGIKYASGVTIPSVFDYYDVEYSYDYVPCEEGDESPECLEYGEPSFTSDDPIGLAPVTNE